MNKSSLLIIRIVCLVVVGSFFLSYFVVSCGGAEVNISGMEAAFGIDKEDIPLDPSPMLLVIPVVTLVVLVVLSVPTILKKQEIIKSQKISFFSVITMIGSIIGLIMLAVAHNGAIGKVQRELGARDISKYYHTGVGFKICVIAFIVMFVMPFVDKFILKNLPPQNNASPD